MVKNISPKVKQVCRRKKREHVKHGNGDKYKELKKKVNTSIREATTNIIRKQINLVSTKNNCWLKHAKLLAARPGDQKVTSFSISKHVENNFTALGSSNAVCEYFSKISQQYALDVRNLPVCVQTRLAKEPCNHPYLSEHANKR